MGVTTTLPALRGGLLALLAATLFGISTPLIQSWGAGVGAFGTAALLYAGAAAVGALSRRPAHLEARLARSDLLRLFAVAAFGAVVAYAVMTPAKRNWAIVGAVTVALILIGWIGPKFVPVAPQQYIAHLVQTNFPQSESYPADWMTIHAGDLKQLGDISVSAAKLQPGLIVWPEVPAPFSLEDPTFSRFASSVAQDANQYFLVGVLDWKQGADRKWLAFNTAALLDPSGRRIFSYDKIHLLPFGEYVPLRGWLTFA